MGMNLSASSKSLRKKILTIHYAANASHIGSSLSCVDIILALYSEILRIDPQHPYDPERDRFILSKGHAASALYVTLAHTGFFDPSVLNKYHQNGGCLAGHSTKDCVPGVEVSTGSLGHGLSIGAGMAIAARYDNRDSHTFVLLSDGECNEGAVWEAAMFSSRHELENLIAIVDYNKLQAFGRTDDVMRLEPFKDKWLAFGWGVKEIDGHNFDEILEACKSLPQRRKSPSVIIAHTVKGKGVSFMEDQLSWHYKSPNKEELETALKELDS